LVVFAILAVGISCLGLFGLSAFSAEQRTREIGIRKVLGASVSAIVQLLSREYLILIAIANLIAWPVAYYVTGRWLEDFAYHISVGWSTHMAATLLALTIAFATVSFQSIKAARANPVETLKYE
jgi:putative ABC transport system permease protein